MKDFSMEVFLFWYNKQVQHLLILVIILLITALSFLLIKWPGGMDKTFSQHAAATKWSKVYYSLLFVVTLPLLFWYISGWLVSSKNMPDAFLWFAGIAVAFQILCTFFPEEGDLNIKIHRILTGISGVAMLPMVAIIAFSSSVSTFVNVIALLGLFIMIVLLGIALTYQKVFRRALLLQVGYYTAFFAILLSVTYS